MHGMTKNEYSEQELIYISYFFILLLIDPDGAMGGRNDQRRNDRETTV
jgi:hypothetical protein